MRLWLSDKAAKAMKDLPSAMKGLEGQKAAPAGDETAEAKEKRLKDEEARAAQKASRDQLRETTAKADVELNRALDAAQAAERLARDTEHRLSERKKDAKHCRAAVEDAERRLEEAQKALERVRKEATRAEEQVPQLAAQLETEKTALGTEKERLQKALTEADAAWREVNPRNKKKRDRRPRHAAIQLLGIRPPVEAESEGQEGEGQDGASGEGPVGDAIA